MEDQVEQAVEIALQGNASQELKQQAMNFCQHVKESPDGWQMCLNLFSGRKRSYAARFFALQVVDNFLEKNGINYSDALIRIKDVLFSYVSQQYSNNSDIINADAPFMKNKLAQTMAYLFLLTYTNQIWPSFFDDLLSLTSSPECPNQFDNLQGTDIYLRILQVIHGEIGDTLILRSEDQIKRNNLIKDQIRSQDMSKLADSWLKILQKYASSQSNQSNQSNPVSPEEVSENCLKVIGGWVSWINISLIVTPDYMNLIFSILTNPKLRLFASDTLGEIVAKKMRSADKLELISLLNVYSLLSQLNIGSDNEFDERIAKFLNIVALELIHILDDSTTDPSLLPIAEERLVNLWQLLLAFLGNEYDDTTSQIFPALSEYLTLLRKDKKRSGSLSPERQSILESLLKTIIMKMKYDDSTEWTDEDSDSESDFLEMRARLRRMQDSIAAIDEGLFINTLSQVITQSLSENSSISLILNANNNNQNNENNNKNNGMGVKPWQEIELGLYELFAFGEGLKNASLIPKAGYINSSQLPPITQILIELVEKMVSSTVIFTSNHPAVHLQFMELVVRYSPVFDVHPKLIPRVMEFFVSASGIHNSVDRVKARAWYLFYRFVRISTKYFIADSETVKSVLMSIGNLLSIQAELPSSKDSDSDISVNEASDEGLFDSQLYLFEAVGFLIATIGPSNKSMQLDLIQQVLSPIYADMEKYIPQATAADTAQFASLQVHHHIMAIGTFSRGFGDGHKSIVTTTGTAIKDGDLVIPFKNASEAILVSLNTLSEIGIIRDAARFSFSRMVVVLGPEIIANIPRLLSCLLERINCSEISDFLGFLGQLIHTYRDENIDTMVDSLFQPLFSKLFTLLNEKTLKTSSSKKVSFADQNNGSISNSINDNNTNSNNNDSINNSGNSVSENLANSPDVGTDEFLLRIEMRKAYLSFINIILNNGLAWIFVSDTNRQMFDTVLQSILTYSAEPVDATSQKLSFNVLVRIIISFSHASNKAVSLSGISSVPNNNNEINNSTMNINFDDPENKYLLRYISSNDNNNNKNGNNTGNIVNQRQDTEFIVKNVKHPEILAAYSLPESFILESNRICWTVPSSGQFNFQDGKLRLVLSEIGATQKSLAQCFPQFTNFVAYEFLPSFAGISSTSAREYAQALTVLDYKSFRKYFTDFVKNLAGQ